jgi:hypothetical protein
MNLSASWKASLAALGAGHVRIPLRWNHGNPGSSAGGAQTSGDADTYIKNIRGMGAQPFVIYGGDAHDNTGLNATDAAAFVAHYNGSGGSTHGGPVKYWVVGNEPDISNGGGDSAYLSMLPGVIAAMHGVDPSVVISAPAAAWWDSGLLKSAAAVKGVGILSYHAYNGGDAAPGGFPNESAYHANIQTLKTYKSGIRCGVEEANWHYVGGSTAFFDWRNTCFIADTAGQVLSAICFVAADAGELRAAVAERLKLTDGHAEVRAEADALLDKMFSLRLRVPESPSDRLWEMIAHPPHDETERERRIRRGVRRRIARAASEAVTAVARGYDRNSDLTPEALADTTLALCDHWAWTRTESKDDSFEAGTLAGVDLTWMGPTARDRHRDLFAVEIGRATRAYFLNSADRLARLDKSVKPWLRLPPRRAKRLYNHARLLYALSLSRGVLGSTVTPRYIGLWAVLSDTWPSVAEVVARKTEELHEVDSLGASARKKGEAGLDEVLESFELPPREVAEAKAFLVKLMSTGEFGDFVLAIPELAGLLPYQEVE